MKAIMKYPGSKWSIADGSLAFMRIGFVRRIGAVQGGKFFLTEVALSTELL